MRVWFIAAVEGDPTYQSDLVLVSRAGGIYDAQFDSENDLFGNRIDLMAFTGIGLLTDALEINSSTNGRASGRLYATAGDGIYITETQGSLWVLAATTVRDNVFLTVPDVNAPRPTAVRERRPHPDRDRYATRAPGRSRIGRPLDRDLRRPRRDLGSRPHPAARRRRRGCPAQHRDRRRDHPDLRRLWQRRPRRRLADGVRRTRRRAVRPRDADSDRHDLHLRQHGRRPGRLRPDDPRSPHPGLRLEPADVGRSRRQRRLHRRPHPDDGRGERRHPPARRPRGPRRVLRVHDGLADRAQLRGERPGQRRRRRRQPDDLRRRRQRRVPAPSDHVHPRPRRQRGCERPGDGQPAPRLPRLPPPPGRPGVVDEPAAGQLRHGDRRPAQHLRHGR